METTNKAELFAMAATTKKHLCPFGNKPFAKTKGKPGNTPSVGDLKPKISKKAKKMASLSKERKMSRVRPTMAVVDRSNSAVALSVLAASFVPAALHKNVMDKDVPQTDLKGGDDIARKEFVDKEMICKECDGTFIFTEVI